MENNTDNSVVYSKEVIEFLTVANSFCDFIQDISKLTTKEFSNKLLKLLPFLYLKASLLPQIESNADETQEKFVTEMEWNKINKEIAQRLQLLDHYKEFINPLSKGSEEQFVGSIGENIADIYQDVKDFVLAYKVGNIEVMSESLYEVKHNFENYWGQSLLNSMKTLHHIFYNEASFEELDKH